MSLMFVDSFDHYFNLLDKYDVVATSNIGTLATVAARNGVFGLHIENGTNYGDWLGKNIPATTTLYFGMAIYVLYVSTTWVQVVKFVDGGTSQLDLNITGSGNFYFSRNGITIGSQTTQSMSFSAWHYIEVKVTINGSSGIAELKVDGNYWIQLSGQNTQVTGNATASQIRFGIAGISTLANAGFYIDDVYLLNSAGSVNNNYLGDVKIQASFPTGNGTLNNYTQNAASWVASTVMYTDQQIIDSNGNLQRVTNFTGDDKTGSSPPTWSTGALGSTTTDNHVTWTLIQKAPLSNYNFINEPLPDDNQSYLSDATVSDQDRYTFGAVSGASVFGVAVNMRAQKDDSATRSIRAVTKSSTTVADNGTDFPLSESVYAPYQGFFEVDPNTSTAWTISGVNAAEFGIKTTA